jgi:hypothetical protein
LLVVGTARAAEPEGASGTSSAAAPVSNAAPIELDDIGLAGVTEASPEAQQEQALRLDGLALLHIADGIGAGGQLRAGAFGLRASVGFETMFFIADDNTEDAKMGRFEFASGLQVNVDTLLVFGAAERGASVGYRYNSVLGHGAAIAYQSTLQAFGERFVFYVPIIYFPEGTSLARKELDLSSRHRINFPFGAGLQYGMGIAWMF